MSVSSTLLRSTRGTGSWMGARLRGRGPIVVSRSSVSRPSVSREVTDEEALHRSRRPERLWRARLLGVNQVPPVATPATGTFRARLSPDEDEIQYELRYANLSTDALFAHIHFGHPTDNGGVMAFLCGGDDKAACPVRGGEITGTIRAEDIVAIPEQGVAAGDFATALRIIRAGLAYVNVHSEAFPDGEIRGQIRFSR